MAADALKECPKEHCAQKRWGHGLVKRQITAGSGLLFKGSGFYITDYRSEGYKAAAKQDASSGSASSSSSSGSSGGGDSKPAAKAEAKPAKPAAASKPKS